MSEITVNFGGQPIEVQFGENTAAALSAAVRAEDAAANAEAFAGPSFANTAAGLAATTDGDFFAVNDSGIVTIYLNDGGSAVAQRTIATTAALAATGGAALVGFQRDGAGTVARTVEEKIGEKLSMEDLGAVGDGVTDDGAIIDAAILARFGRKSVLRQFVFNEIHGTPGKTYRFATPVTIRQTRMRFIGNGATIECTGAHAFDISQDADGASGGNEDGMIYDWKITGATTSAIRGQTANFWTISKNWIEDCADGIDVQGVAMKIRDNYIRDNTGVGLRLRSGLREGGIAQSIACLIEGNRIWVNGGGGLQIAEGSGNMVIANDIEGNTGWDVYNQASTGTRYIGNYCEPVSGATVYLQDNTASLLAGAVTSQRTFHSGWHIGGNAAWDFDIVGGNNTYIEGTRYGTGNVRIGSGVQNTRLLPGNTDPVVTDNGTNTFNWSQIGRLSQVKAISSTSVVGTNRSGFVDISGTNSTATVTFPTAEPNASYRVTGLVVGRVSGVPDPDSFQAHVFPFPTTAGFGIALRAAPGAGTSVRVWWAIER